MICACGREVVQAQSDSGATMIVEHVPRVLALTKDGHALLIFAHIAELFVDHWCPRDDKHEVRL